MSLKRIKLFSEFVTEQYSTQEDATPPRETATEFKKHDFEPEVESPSITTEKEEQEEQEEQDK